ncbi:MAG: hypothetical protein IT580_05930, partial [Verrucomicrobiales bacterium]|nr:hypothetical protein [Verrucomicrobiales bacterium]
MNRTRFHGIRTARRLGPDVYPQSCRGWLAARALGYTKAMMFTIAAAMVFTGWSGSMRAQGAQPFVKTIQPVGSRGDVAIQSTKVSEDGSLMVAGVYSGIARFSSTLELDTGTAKMAVFLAKQDGNGGWAWAKTLVRQGEGDFYQVNDIAIAGTNVVVGGEWSPAGGGTRRGWVAVQEATRPAVAPVFGSFHGGTDPVAYASVSRVAMGRDGALYAGGKFRKSLTDGVRTVAGIVPASGALYDQDIFILRLDAQARISWAIRSGSSLQDLPVTAPARANGMEEDVVGLEVDAEGTVLVAFNAAGTIVPLVRPVFLLHANSAPYQNVYTGYEAGSAVGFSFGALSGLTGRISSTGNWLTIGAIEFNLGLDRPLRTIASVYNVPATDATLADGKFYVCGTYVSGSTTNGFLIRTGADTVRPDGPVVYLRSTSTDPTTPVSVDARGGKVMVSGGMGRTLRQHQVALTDSDLGGVDSEITSLRVNQFLAAYSGELRPLWARTTTRPNDEGAPSDLGGRALAYDSLRRVVFWGGHVRDGQRKLFLGEEDNPVVLGPAGARTAWLTALEDSGRYREQVKLVVNSAFGPITVNGSAAPSPVVDTILLRDTTVVVGVPAQFPAVVGATDLTRQRCTGFRIDGTVVSGDANQHTFVLTADTSMTFGWQTEHRLTIQSDHATAGLSGTAAAGSAEPPIGVTWIRAGELVNAFIDGLVLPVDIVQTGTRYIVTGYEASGAAGTNLAFPQVAARQQVPQFAMTQPATIRYRWKQQHRLQISTTSDAVMSLPLARQLSTNGTEVARGAGTGEFWFDHGAPVQVLAPVQDTALRRELKGWRNADPADGFFPRIEFIAPDDAIPDYVQLDVHLDAVVESRRSYLGRSVASFARPMRVSWDFGDLVFRVNTAIGERVVLPAGVTVAPGKAPVGVRLVEAPPGSTSADVQVWDDVADRAYPLRPGIFYLDWDDGAGGRIVTQVFAGFPGDPIPQTAPAAVFAGRSHFRHIAASAPEVTPAVRLDAATEDAQYFLGLKYQTGTASVVDGAFLAGSPGRGVLLFSLSTNTARAATGDLTREILAVRVVETRSWDAATDWSGASGMVKTGPSAVVGARLTSAFDTAGLGTGYLIHSNANYHAGIHDRLRAQGPIIPVNRFPASYRIPAEHELVVVWYERIDGILWPYQPVRYPSFEWPAKATGPDPAPEALKRIVIASRLGSEGLDHVGNLQPRLAPPRYQAVKIYQQPDRRLPGFNPNEEHARIYPSLLAGEDGLTAPTAFALRNDLNVSAALMAAQPGRFHPSDYTSDPYVLVEFVDTETGEPGMAVYEVQREDSSTRDPRLTELPGAGTDSYEFRYTVRAGELLQPLYPLNLVIGLNPCVNTMPALFTTPKSLPNGSWFEDVNPAQRTWFVDHKGQAWAVSGDSALLARYQYPLANDFWYPIEEDGVSGDVAEGDCVPFLPLFDPANGLLGAFAADAPTRWRSAPVRFNTAWPTNAPVLKVGETLTYAGGEYAADHPESPGLPGILGWAAGEVVFDSMNASMSTTGLVNHVNRFVARVISPLEERLVALPAASLPDALKPGSPDVRVEGDRWFFTKLSPSLQKRVFFQPLAKLRPSDAPGVLGLRGYVNDRTLGASDLTASPPPVYVLEPNILTATERSQVRDLASGSVAWTAAVTALADLSRNPTGVDADRDHHPDTGWLAGLQPEIVYDDEGANPVADVERAAPLRGLGPGLALVTNPRL